MSKEHNDGPSETVYCGKCRVEGKDTPLFYSDPPNKELDTWNRRLAKKKDYRCKEHIKSDNRLYMQSKRNTLFKQHKEKIDEYNQKKILEFERIWNDISVSGLPDPERLMEALRQNNIRGQPGHEGFTAEEMTEVIRASDINFSVSAFVEQWDKDNTNISRYTRELAKTQIIRALLPFEEDIRSGNRRRVINGVRGLIQVANVIYEKKGIYEKIVTTPQHKDPAGNAAFRFHLLTYEETLERRAAKKRRQMASIDATMKREEKVQYEVSKKLQEGDSNSSIVSKV